MIAIASFLHLAIALPFAQAGDDPRLSYDLVEWPSKDLITPEVLDDEGAAMLSAMAVIGGMGMQVSLIAKLNFFGTPEAVVALASYSKSMVDALMKEGFEREQAIRIHTLMGLPRVPSE